MDLLCVGKEEYDEVTNNCKYVYNNSWFHELNKGKVDYIRYFLFKSKKYKFGIVAGVINNEMKFPYSAPFSIFEKLNNDISVENIDGALKLLEEYSKNNNINKIIFRLPPFFYDESFCSKMSNSLIRQGYMLHTYDLNYQFYIKDEEELKKSLKRNALKNLNISEKFKYKLLYCDDINLKNKAYDIIAINRRSKGYPLRMTWEQVETTMSNLEHDVFLLVLDEAYVASAIVFKVTDDVYQVIYWGDTGDNAEKRPMNYLAYHLYLYYEKKGIKVLDIGPSTENGIPNYGLCSFKESIGCEVSSKITYLKEL